VKFTVELGGAMDCVIKQLTKTIVAAGVLGFASSSALAQERNPERNAYFGETHLHTSWSVDAWVMGNRLTRPDDALKYAQPVGRHLRP
jgi:Protein of unknown function (DUF3604)